MRSATPSAISTAYALAVKPDEISDAGIRQQQDKLFYVSPFIEMAMRYHFRVSPPADDVKLRILETDREGPLLAATFHGRRRALTTAALLRAFVLAAARHLQDRRGDPLGSVAALAQRRASGAARRYCTCESCLQYRLGDWPTR